jgi:bacterioferritin-associated ferredoxin
MIVCICHRVSDHDIARVTREGCASFDELQFELAVSTSCGKCHDCARQTFHRHQAAQARAGAAEHAGHCTPSHATVRMPMRLHRETSESATA